jgi:hypothetical protein
MAGLNKAAKEAAEENKAGSTEEVKVQEEVHNHELDHEDLGAGEESQEEFDEFFNFSEDGDTLTGELLKPYFNPTIGDDGFKGYIFRLWEKGLPVDSRIKVAVRSSYALNKHFGGISETETLKFVFKITMTGKKQLDENRSLKLFSVIKYKNPNYRD